MKTKTINRADVLFLIALTIVSFAVTMYFSLFGMDAHHDGVMMKNALDVARGRVLYTESISQYGMLVSFIQAFFIKIFGEHLWSIHFATTVFYVICYDVTYLICKRFVPKTFAFIINLLILLSAPFYFWDFLPWSNVYGLCFLICCLYTIFRFIEERKQIYIVLSAVFSCLAYFSKMPIGMVIYLALFMLFIILWLFYKQHRGWRNYILTYLVSALLCCSIFFSYLGVNHATGMWWEQTVGLAFSFASDQSMATQMDGQKTEEITGNEEDGALHDDTIAAGESAYPTFPERVKMMLSGVIVMLFSYYFSPRIRIIPIICIAIFIFCIGKVAYDKRRSGSKDIILIEMMCFSVFALASWSQYYPVVCLRHIFWGAFLMFAVVLIGLYKLFVFVEERFIKGNKELASIFGVLISIGIFFCIHYDTLKVNLVSIYATVAYDSYCMEDNGFPYLQGIRMDEVELEFYEDFEQTLRKLQKEYPKTDIVNMSFLNILSCYSDKNHGNLYSLYGYGPLSHSMEHWDNDINQEHPIIFSDIGVDPTKYPGYKQYHEVIGSHGDIYAVGEMTPAFYVYCGDDNE